MSKSILVIDTPECCEECPLELDVAGRLNVNICRGCEEYSFYSLNTDSKKKPEWCPLRQVPEKMEVCGKCPQSDGIVPSYKIGWNACIDEILKN